MKLGKILIAGLAAASLSAPSLAAVRPSVKPIDASVQKSVAPGVHQAGRSAAKLKDSNGFIPAFGAGIVGFITSTAVVVTTIVVVNEVVEIPLISDILEEVGIGDDYGNDSTN